MKNESRWQDSLNVMLGVWLIIAPLVGVGYMNDLAAWNSYMMGAGVVTFTALAVSEAQVWEEWINIVLAAWLIIGPFVLGYAGSDNAPTWNQLIVGAIIGIDAIWTLVQPPPGKSAMT